MRKKSEFHYQKPEKNPQFSLPQDSFFWFFAQKK